MRPVSKLQSPASLLLLRRSITVPWAVVLWAAGISATAVRSRAGALAQAFSLPDLTAGPSGPALFCERIRELKQTVDHSGSRNASGVIRIHYTACAVGTFLGPLLAGAAFDLYEHLPLPPCPKMIVFGQGVENCP